MRTRPAPVTALLLGLAFLAGCGGSKTEAKAPTAPNTAGPEPNATAAPPTEGAVPPVGNNGQPPQGIASGPLKMSAAAQDAYMRGATAYGAGDVAGARTAFQQATSADSHAYQAHYSLGVVLERQNDPRAADEYRQAFTIQRDYEPAIAAYALNLGNHGKLGEADSFLQGKRGELPNSAGVLAALAEIKSMQRDTAAAQSLAQEALKKNSNYRPAMVTIARDHYRNRRLDLALYALQAILDGFGDENPPRDRDNGDAHYLRGLILKEEGRRAAAIEELRKAVALRPDLVAARVELASYFLEAGNSVEALPLLDGALRYNPDHVVAHLDLGDCYRLAGRIPEAKAQFDWVLAHDTSLPQVHYDLGLLYLFSPSVPGMDGKRQTEEAIAEITRYQQMRGKLAAGQSDDSEELLNRAKQKQADLQAQAEAKQPVPAPPPAAAPKSNLAPAPPPAATPPKANPAPAPKAPPKPAKKK